MDDGWDGFSRSVGGVEESAPSDDEMPDLTLKHTSPGRGVILDGWFFFGFRLVPSLLPSAMRQPRLTSSQLMYLHGLSTTSLRGTRHKPPTAASNGRRQPRARCRVVAGSQCDMCVVGFCFPGLSIPSGNQPAPPCMWWPRHPPGWYGYLDAPRQTQTRIIVDGTAPWRRVPRWFGAHVEGRDAWETPLVLPGCRRVGG